MIKEKKSVKEPSPHTISGLNRDQKAISRQMLKRVSLLKYPNALKNYHTNTLAKRRDVPSH